MNGKLSSKLTAESKELAVRIQPGINPGGIVAKWDIGTRVR
jgi:hypothetical protein